MWQIDYSGYPIATRRRVAAENLERWEAQMGDLIASGCFGEHLTENCAECRASRLVGLMIDLRRVLLQPCLPNAQDHRADAQGDHMNPYDRNYSISSKAITPLGTCSPDERARAERIIAESADKPIRRIMRSSDIPGYRLSHGIENVFAEKSMLSNYASEKERIVALLKKHGGFMRTRELVKNGKNMRVLRKIQEDGLISSEMRSDKGLPYRVWTIVEKIPIDTPSHHPQSGKGNDA